MIKHIRKQKLKDFKKFIYERMEPDEFEERWAAFLLLYGVSEQDAWFSRMYELRGKWAAAYTKGGYFLRMSSNQRSESLNSGLHNHLDRMMSMVDLLEHSQYFMSRIRRNEGELDAKASQSVPFTRISDHPLLKSAARIYTPEIFKWVKEQFVKSGGWEIRQMTQEDASLVRWTMQAKFGLVPERNGSTQVWFDQMDRYRQLRNKANSVLFRVSLSTEKSNRVLDFFDSISDDEADNAENDDSSNNGENNVATKFGPLPAYFSSSSKAFHGKVLDPLPIKPRGAPSKKRPKAFHERFNSRDRADDGDARSRFSQLAAACAPLDEGGDNLMGISSWAGQRRRQGLVAPQDRQTGPAASVIPFAAVITVVSL
uniref:Uncharacterized protein n=1 Tax=Avena sativa TaxID=4498 RepID=A0ACD6ATI9_AVESA